MGHGRAAGLEGLLGGHICRLHRNAVSWIP